MRQSLSIDWSPDLFYDLRPIPGFTASFTLSETSDVRVFGHIDIAHRKIIQDVIGAALDVALDGIRIPGSVTGENISVSRHYYAAQIHAFAEAVPPGQHTIEVRARSYSSAAPGANGLAEVKGNYNQVIIEALPHA